MTQVNTAAVAAGVQKGQVILATVLQLVGLYRQVRKEVQDAVPATDAATGGAADPLTGQLLTDEDLAQLLKLDAQALETKVAGLLAKHGAAPASDGT
jgi:hypothetical protein